MMMMTTTTTTMMMTTTTMMMMMMMMMTTGGSSTMIRGNLATLCRSVEWDDGLVRRMRRTRWMSSEAESVMAS
jgi:hypothetical protein